MMSDKETLTIGKPCLLLCEGADEEWFLIWYLNQYLIKENASFDDIQIVNFGGNEELRNKLKILFIP